MKYNVSHRTSFSYAQEVTISHQVMHLEPRTTDRQTVLSSGIIVEPPPTVRAERADFFGNAVTYLTVQEPHRHLIIHAKSHVEVLRLGDIDLESSPPWESVQQSLAAKADPELRDAVQFAFQSPYIDVSEGVRRYALESFTGGRPLLDAAVDLTSRIFRDFTYKGGVTDISTPVDEVLENKQGVCQDFAHLQIACLRSLGLPARYVSGYLMTHPPEGQERLVGADASHAWLAVWCPKHGWIDVDPTNDLIVQDEHITVGWGRDYGDVSPINGSIMGGGRHQIDVSVDVAPEAA